MKSATSCAFCRSGLPSSPIENDFSGLRSSALMSAIELGRERSLTGCANEESTHADRRDEFRADDDDGDHGSPGRSSDDEMEEALARSMESSPEGVK